MGILGVTFGPFSGDGATPLLQSGASKDFPEVTIFSELPFAFPFIVMAGKDVG